MVARPSGEQHAKRRSERDGMVSDQQRPPESMTAPEREAFPPLPDGGLGRSMPDWLRDEPEAGAERLPAVTIDPSNLIRPDDLPDWLRQLSPEHRQAPTSRPSTALIPAAHPASRSAEISPTPPPSEPRRARLANAGHTAMPRPDISPASTPHANPNRRRAMVTALGFLLLAIAVVAYLYARGGL